MQNAKCKMNVSGFAGRIEIVAFGDTFILHS